MGRDCEIEPKTVAGYGIKKAYVGHFFIVLTFQMHGIWAGQHLSLALTGIPRIDRVVCVGRGLSVKRALPEQRLSLAPRKPLA